MDIRYLGVDVGTAGSLGRVVDRGMSVLIFQSYVSLHICITLPMAKPGIVEKFLKDVRECSSKIMKNPNWETTGTVRELQSPGSI